MRGPEDHTRPIDRLKVRQYFSAYPHRWTDFDPAWVVDITNPLIGLEEVPPIFWTLADERCHQPFEECLHLVQAQNGLQSLIHELKLTDESTVVPLLRELQVFRRLHLAHGSVLWKPRVGLPGGPSPDLSLSFHGRSILIEVFTLRESKDESELSEPLAEIHRFINRMHDHYFMVSYEVENKLEPKQVPRCKSFLKRTIRDLIRTRQICAERFFSCGGQKILVFEFKIQQGRKGHWAGALHPMRQVEDAGRIKGKLLDKLESFQFPTGTDHLKGYVVVLEERVGDHDAVISAIQGRSAVLFRGVPGSHTTELIRQQDGVVSFPGQGKLLLEEVDFVASMRARGGLSLDLEGVLVNGERKRIGQDEVSDIFR